MQSKKRLLQGSKLYLILDAQVNDYTKLFEITKIAVKSGVKIIQLRDKFGLAKDILNFVDRIRPFIKDKAVLMINDRVDLALAARADGVHLGQDDLPIDFARKMLGKKAIIGISCQSDEHARNAEKFGADYIGFGSVFKTLTKPERRAMDLKLLKRVVHEIKIPLFAIGGINLNNIKGICSLGVKRVAVCREVCNSQNISLTIERFNKILRE